MSKCREEYEKHTAIPWNYDKDTSQLWQAAWNVRGKLDAEICRVQASGYGEHGWIQAATNCAEAIEQEQCE